MANLTSEKEITLSDESIKQLLFLQQKFKGQDANEIAAMCIAEAAVAYESRVSYVSALIYSFVVRWKTIKIFSPTVSIVACVIMVMLYVLTFQSLISEAVFVNYVLLLFYCVVLIFGIVLVASFFVPSVVSDVVARKRPMSLHLFLMQAAVFPFLLFWLYTVYTLLLNDMEIATSIDWAWLGLSLKGEQLVVLDGIVGAQLYVLQLTAKGVLADVVEHYQWTFGITQFAVFPDSNYQHHSFVYRSYVGLVAVRFLVARWNYKKWQKTLTN